VSKADECAFCMLSSRQQTDVSNLWIWKYKILGKTLLKCDTTILN
jgi:hypothetical protein